MELIVENEAQLDEVVNAFLAFPKENKIVFLEGDLGAGKTTFVKSLMNYFGVEDDVSSPTYSLVNTYLFPEGKVYHIDLYRLVDTHEALDMGIEEYLDSGDYCLIEWPDVVKNLVDQATVIKVETLDDNSRKFKIQKLIP